MPQHPTIELVVAGEPLQCGYCQCWTSLVLRYLSMDVDIGIALCEDCLGVLSQDAKDMSNAIRNSCKRGTDTRR